jgi:hypothetical protein
MSIIQGTAKGGSTRFYDFPIGDSLRFDGSSYLTGNFSTNTDATSATYSFWVKRSKLGVDEHIFGHRNTSNNNNRIYINFVPADQIQVIYYNSSATLIGNVKPTAVLRDTSAWYHFVLVFDINGSNSAKIRWYINGELITDLASSTYPSTSVRVINSSHSTIGANPYGDGSTFNNKINCYLANIQFIDGQALDQYFFGEFKDNIWVPYNAFSAANSGTASDGDTATNSYGTNGFRLAFDSADFNWSGSSTMTDPYGSGTAVPIYGVADASGNGKHWVMNS